LLLINSIALVFSRLEQIYLMLGLLSLKKLQHRYITAYLDGRVIIFQDGLAQK
jgi:hypothetical protein